jgi:hypothetical protein
MATISIVAARSGSGPTSTITLTSGDTTNAKAWAPAPFNPTAESDLAAVKEAVWAEILRQMQAV